MMRIESESQAVEILDDSRREAVLREVAALYLEHHPARRLIPRLVLALQDDDEGVRWAAARTLSQLGQPALLELLQALMDPDRVGDPRLREGAYRMLHRNAGLSKWAAPLLHELRGFIAADIGTMIEAHHLYWQLREQKRSAGPAFDARRSPTVESVRQSVLASRLRRRR